MITDVFYIYGYPVCFSVMDKFAATLTNNEKKDPKMIEEKFRQYCKKAKGKDQRFVSI